MALSNHPQGYQCECIDTVNDFYCKKCNLVARKLTFTSCCGKSYCQACIADTQQQEKPCPACGQEKFSTQQQIKDTRAAGYSLGTRPGQLYVHGRHLSLELQADYPKEQGRPSTWLRNASNETMYASIVLSKPPMWWWWTHTGQSAPSSHYSALISVG